MNTDNTPRFSALRAAGESLRVGLALVLAMALLALFDMTATPVADVSLMGQVALDVAFGLLFAAFHFVATLLMNRSEARKARRAASQD